MIQLIPVSMLAAMGGALMSTPQLFVAGLVVFVGNEIAMRVRGE